jgi:hypothetical protein
MSTQNKKGISALTATIAASFFAAAITLGFAMSIYQGTLGNADPARGELNEMLDNVNDSCAQGISNYDDFEPGAGRTNDGGEVTVCPSDDQSLCYGDTTAQPDYLACESIEIDNGCSIRQGTRYSYETNNGVGEIGCE